MTVLLAIGAAAVCVRVLVCELANRRHGAGLSLGWVLAACAGLAVAVAAVR